ncbi:MAG: rod shape-determining protein MreD [Actinomycetia bacterium]|nr:rod shape-determining protein MreD [Actinomycetes bacterium]
MQRILRLLLVLIGCVILQTSVFPHLRILDAVPEVALVASIAVAYRSGPETGAVFGFAVGLSVDLFVHTPAGLMALSCAVTAYIVGILQAGLVRSTPWAAPILAGVFGLFGGFLFVTVGVLVGRDELMNAHSIQMVLLSAAYDVLISPLVFPVARWAAAEPSTPGGMRRW